MAKSTDIEKVRQSVRDLGRADAYEIYNGKVSAVDEGATTCDVDIDEGVTVFDVRLRVVITDDTGMWVLPKVGSDVIIGQVENGTDYEVIKTSEIDKVFIKIGDNSIVMDATELNGYVEYRQPTGRAGGEFNGGSNGGIPIAQNVSDQLNALESDVNDLKTALQTVLGGPPIAEPGNGAPSALQIALNAALATWSGAPITPTTPPDIENPDLTQ